MNFIKTILSYDGGGLKVPTIFLFLKKIEKVNF